MLTRLDHVAIAVTDFDEAVHRFASDLGLRLEGTEDVLAAKTRTAFLPIEGTRIELLHPLHGEGPVAAHLAKRGPGLHHLCFETDDIYADMKRLKELGYELLSAEPTRGAHDTLVVFVHPRSCGGVLIELAQHGAPRV